MGNEDYYYITQEILTEEQVILDAIEDGLFLVPSKRALWTLSDYPESKRRRHFGENSTARGPDFVNL